MYYYCVHVHDAMGAHVSQGERGSQRTTLKSWFSPFTFMWFQGFTLVARLAQQVLYQLGLSHWTIFFLLQAIVLEKNGINGQESSLSVALLPLPRCVMWPNPGHRSLPFVTGCFFYLSSFWFSYWAVASAHGSALLFRLLWFLWPKVPSLSLFDKL